MADTFTEEQTPQTQEAPASAPEETQTPERRPRPERAQSTEERSEEARSEKEREARPRPERRPRRRVQREYAAPTLGEAFRGLPRVMRYYLTDPAGTSRRMAENRQWLTGVLLMLLTVAMSFVSTFLFGVRYCSYFSKIMMEWITAGVVTPILAYVLNFALLYCLTALARMRVDIRAVFAAVGVNSILALVLLAASSLLSLISYSIFTVMSVLILLAWLVSFYLEVFQVFSIRMNIVNMTVLILGLTVTFFAVTLLRDWFFSSAVYFRDGLIGIFSMF